MSEKEIEGVKYTVDGDEKWIPVGVRGTRRITIREFKGSFYPFLLVQCLATSGKTYVDIREVSQILVSFASLIMDTLQFYVDKQTSELKAGKKGISLSVGEVGPQRLRTTIDKIGIVA